MTYIGHGPRHGFDVADKVLLLELYLVWVFLCTKIVIWCFVFDSVFNTTVFIVFDITVTMSKNMSTSHIEIVWFSFVVYIL
jgi:hypothetical protein